MWISNKLYYSVTYIYSMKYFLSVLALCFFLLVHSQILAQCSFSDCPGNPIFSVSPPEVVDGELVFNDIQVGNFTCTGSSPMTTGLSIFVYELLPDGSRVSNCANASAEPDNHFVHIELGLASGPGCGISVPISSSSNPLIEDIGFFSCDGSVYEIEVYLYLDSNGSIIGSSTPVENILNLNSDQYEVLTFGPIHNSTSGLFPSTGFGGPLIVNELGNWDAIQLEGSPGQNFTLDCDQDIELFARGTSNLNHCGLDDFSSSLVSELSNVYTYSVNGGTPIDLIASLSANAPSSGGILTGLNPFLGQCYSGIFTTDDPTIISVEDINPSDGDIVNIVLSTTDAFTGVTETSSIFVTYTGTACIDMIEGCTDISACNYIPDASIDDGSCISADCEGNCNGMNSGPAQPGSTCDDGDSATVGDTWTSACICVGMSPVGGCTDVVACNYNPDAEADDGSCISADCEGNCNGMNSGPAQPGTSCNDGQSSTDDDTWNSECICIGVAPTGGCTDISACNYDAEAGIDDGSCNPLDCLGFCDGMNSGPAQPGTACDDGDSSTVGDTWTTVCDCVGMSPLGGCTDVEACNYNPNAEADDGSCISSDCAGNCDGYYAGPAQPGTECDDGDSNTVNDLWTMDCSCLGEPIVLGCTDILACNYSSDANSDDSSCLISGEACDDGDPLTDYDTVNENCECAGTSTNVEFIENRITIIPNPAAEKVRISGIEKVERVEVIDIHGRVLSSERKSSVSSLELDVSKWESGFYFIQLHTDSESYISKLIRK